MKKVSLTIVLIIIIVPFQTSNAQTNPCAVNNEKAEEALKEYLTKEKNIQGLRDDFDILLNSNAKDSVTSLENPTECQQLKSNLDWLESQKHYSTYKIADHYFIVIYFFTKEGNFKLKEIPVVDNNYTAVGSIIFPDTFQ